MNGWTTESVCERHARLDPGRRRIDDRRTGQHVRLVDAIAQHCGCDGKLRASVDSQRCEGVGADPGRGSPAGGDDVRDRVGQVELALGVVRIELLERVPQRAGLEHVDRRVHLPDRALGLGSVLVLDDRLDRAVGAPDDPAVRKHCVGHEREDRHGGAMAPVLIDQRPQVIAGQQGRGGVEDEDTPGEAIERRARRGDRVAGAERPLLHHDLDAVVGVSGRRRGDDHERVGSRLERGLDHPVDDAAAEQRVEVLRQRRAHAGAEPAGHHHRCELRRSRFAMAGAPGFEPGIAGPKPAALPLGYAPPG